MVEMIKRRKIIEKSFYAERRYLTYKKTRQFIKTIYYYIKWKWYERKIK